MADWCSPLFNCARHSPSGHSPKISTTGAPRCLYCRNKRRAGCFTSDREAKSPRPRLRRTNYVHPSLVTSYDLHMTYLPMSYISRDCCVRGIRAGCLASGSAVFLRSDVRFLVVYSVLVEGVVSVCILMDMAGFGVGTGSICSAPLPIS